MYPFDGEMTLLCHTWNQDISQFSYFRVHPSSAYGTLGHFIHFIERHFFEGQLMDLRHFVDKIFH